MRTTAKIDRFFLTVVIALTVIGFFVFLSASLGLLAQTGSSFNTLILKQGISLIIGVGAFIFFSKLKYGLLRKLAFIIMLLAIGVNALLFIPSIALHANGASRWIDLGFFTFQPSELLKIAVIIYIAAWIYFVKDRIKTFTYGLLPYLIIIGILSVLLLAQRDTDTLAIIAGTSLIMFVIAGMPIKHVMIALLAMGVVLAGVVMLRPYALDRVKTYLDKSADTQGSGYQINQSLIAIGSGEWFGKGFGQSVQKFGYLPQPTDDSIFAVGAEEFGFAGSVVLIGLYVLFAWSVFRIGTKSADPFGSVLVIGIGVLVITESFLNMAAMMGLVPLSGLPLLFVSHGGTALIITLATAGIVANVSKR